MTRGIRIVAPFRPFPPEAPHHRALSAFDWIDAIRMMAHSAELACRCPVHVITDVDTDLPWPVPCLRYPTHARRLMLWYLEAAACYLASDDFDRDTVALDADQLVYQDLARFFRKDADLGILIRPPSLKGEMLPIFNGVQFWPLRGRDRLAAFYRRALAIAATLPEALIAWGADTIALAQLLEPLAPGVEPRGDLVVELIDSRRILSALSRTQIRWLVAGRLGRFHQTAPVMDFRSTRKVFMRRVYEATIAREVLTA